MLIWVTAGASDRVNTEDDFDGTVECCKGDVDRRDWQCSWGGTPGDAIVMTWNSQR